MWGLIVLIVILVIILIANDMQGQENFPPGPRGLPFVGNIVDLRRISKKTNSLAKTWLYLAKKYGPVVGLRLGLADPIIVVSGREAVLEVLKRQEFDGRPNGFAFTHWCGGAIRGLLFNDGIAWTQQRKFDSSPITDIYTIKRSYIDTAQQLISNVLRFCERNLKELGWLGETMEKMILEDAINLTKVIERECYHGTMNKLNIFTSLAVINSLWSVVSGSRYGPNDADSKMIKVLNSMHQLNKVCNVTGGIINSLPFIRFILPRFTGFDAYNEKHVLAWRFFKKEINRRKEKWQAGLRPNLIDIYLKEIEAHKDDPSSTFTESQLIVLIKDLFSAGIETTSQTIGFTIAYLTVYPEVQDKVQAELDRVVGKHNLPSLEYKKSLHYLNATLKEVVRLANVGATTIPHRATVNTTLMGYEIKKNYTLLPSLVSVHLDKEHWGDPYNFRPERFIDEYEEFVNDPWVMSFGAGRRKCLGEKLAMNTLFLFVVCLLQKFRFELPADQKPPSIIPVDGFTQSPPEFDFIVRRR